jgi:hypothetical protein
MAGIRSHSFTHIYWEKAIYNQRNQVRWDRCCNVATMVRWYCLIPETKIGPSEEAKLLLFAPYTIASTALEKAIFNLTNTGARIPVYLTTISFDLREYATNGFLMPTGGVARRRDTPRCREK